MTTIEYLRRKAEDLEMVMHIRRGVVAHLHNLDQKFQRLDEGQQRLELAFRRLNDKFDGLENRFNGLENRFDVLENKVDEGFFRIDQKLDALLAQSKINLD